MSPRQGLVRGTLTYLRRDLREIVAPTSLPDDDDGRERADDVGGIDGVSSRSSSSSRRRFAGHLRAVASGVSDYCDSWKKPVEAASESAHEEDEDAAALREASGDARDALASASRQAASAAAAAAAATVTGSEALRPALRHLYRTRTAAYRDAVFSFVEGYAAACCLCCSCCCRSPPPPPPLDGEPSSEASDLPPRAARLGAPGASRQAQARTSFNSSSLSVKPKPGPTASRSKKEKEKKNKGRAARRRRRRRRSKSPRGKFFFFFVASCA